MSHGDNVSTYVRSVSMYARSYVSGMGQRS